ncbi:hypothetical protein K493DRAFT_319418 [Basidiobolus meristosporus CBS 931.73]|uniref:CREG-like beta-barrel domain-containing protein n=1 Tax=Basidiobolus meristosporus CBS 931.73 TaxID=1314790 RepID=A0A1Y1XSP2_9FUNG|nr:hypothetical protein K493DRAFT_319418 [Basidiobolus meristosporus CBS 931.73]|eukprot:ORX88516.1 hypothetical protein K493DRAFT_319418 [Basidiobolus meristosporus CBS 931.73]
MVRNYGVGTLITNYPDGQPFGTMDYFSDDCGRSGNPIFLMSTLQVSVQNLQASPRAAFAIQKKLPDQRQSPMPHARFTLMGEIQKLSTDTVNELELKECYLRKHPEAKWWINYPDFEFYRMEVDRIFWIGGFGGFHYIGPIDAEIYHLVDLSGQTPAMHQKPMWERVREMVIQQ